MATFIIADLHLSEKQPILVNAFANFYERHVYLNDRVIIAGDMFDFFVGVDKQSSFHNRIRQIINKAKQRGITTLFQCGNRDFLMTDNAAKWFGMKLVGDFYKIPTKNGDALIIHGDQLCLHDRKYQRFRLFSKSPIIRSLFLMLPMSMRRSIGQKLRDKSRQQEQARAKVDHLSNPVINKAGEKFLQTTGCNILIHGHFHVYGGENDVFGLKTVRMGLGSWGSHYSYIKVDRNETKMVQRLMEKNF